MIHIAFRDTITLLLCGFICMVIWMLQFLNPPAESADTQMPGNLTANISWPAGDIDVDLWLDGPGEPVPIGYSNKGGVLWNLLRDDVGTSPDYTKLNFENAYTRGVPPGEYRINVHCFRCPKAPVEVLLEVAMKSDADAAALVIATSTISLDVDKQEKTGLAFVIDSQGKLDAGSLNTVFEPLRSGRK